MSVLIEHDLNHLMQRIETEQTADMKDIAHHTQDAITMDFWFMKLFGEALEKRASLCYTFHMKYAERSQGNAYYTFTSVTR